MKVRDVMTRDVVTVTPQHTLGQVATLLTQHRISGLPVIDGDRLVGIVTEGDCLRYLRQEAPFYRLYWAPDMISFVPPPPEPDPKDRLEEIRSRPVAAAMTKRVVTVRPDDDIETVAALMLKHKVKRFPVMEGGHMIGIVSRLDLVRTLTLP